MPNLEPSPRPWLASDRFLDRYSTGHRDILDATGEFVAVRVSSADAALIVDAVNERDRLRDLVRRLADSLQGIMDAADGKGEGVLDEALLREARSAIGEDKP